jgi:hypothetical protein
MVSELFQLTGAAAAPNLPWSTQKAFVVGQMDSIGIIPPPWPLEQWRNYSYSLVQQQHQTCLVNPKGICGWNNSATMAH